MRQGAAITECICRDASNRLRPGSVFPAPGADISYSTSRAIAIGYPVDIQPIIRDTRH